jgi:hypothetical protein
VPTPKSKKIEIERRRRQVADLYVQGWTQMSIAEKLAISQTTVSFDLKFLKKEWRESRIRDFDALRELELQKLARIERETWLAWERSQKPAQSADFPGDESASPKRKRNQYGDPRFLAILVQCTISRRALLGLDAPLPITTTVDPDVGLDTTQRSERLLAVLTTISHRSGITVAGEVISAEQSGSVCAARERGEMATRPAPGLPGPRPDRVS